MKDGWDVAKKAFPRMIILKLSYDGLIGVNNRNVRGIKETSSPGRGESMCKDSNVRNHGAVDELKEAKGSWNIGNKKEKRLS